MSDAQAKKETAKSQLAQEQKSMMQLTVNQLNMKNQNQGHWNMYTTEDGSMGAAYSDRKSQVLSDAVLQAQLANLMVVTPMVVTPDI